MFVLRFSPRGKWNCVYLAYKHDWCHLSKHSKAVKYWFFFWIFFGGKQLLTNSSTLVRLYYRCVLCPCCYFSVQPLCAFGVVKVYQYIVSDQQKLIRWLLSNINSGVTEFSWKSGLIDHVCSDWSDNTSTIHKSYSYSWVAFGSNEHFNSGLPSNYSSQPNAGRPLGKMNSRSGDLQAETTCMAACSISFFHEVRFEGGTRLCIPVLARHFFVIPPSPPAFLLHKVPNVASLFALRQKDILQQAPDGLMNTQPSFLVKM